MTFNFITPQLSFLSTKYAWERCSRCCPGTSNVSASLLFRHEMQKRARSNLISRPTLRNASLNGQTRQCARPCAIRRARFINTRHSRLTAARKRASAFADGKWRTETTSPALTKRSRAQRAEKLPTGSCGGGGEGEGL